MPAATVTVSADSLTRIGKSDGRSVVALLGLSILHRGKQCKHLFACLLPV